MERLDKFLCGSGAGTRSQVKDILKAGRVTVDGNPEKDGSRKIDPAVHTVTLDGQPLGGKRRMVVMLNKPAGYVTATEDAAEKTVMELLPEAWRHMDLRPVGRLDKATEGLLLFTNDGAFANRLMHPSHEVEKCYLTWVQGEDVGEAVEYLRYPMEIDGYMTRGAEVDIISLLPGGAELAITIHEGRNRQVRKMCAAVGLRVTKLRRVREGSVELGDLPAGKWRSLTAEEIASFDR